MSFLSHNFFMSFTQEHLMLKGLIALSFGTFSFGTVEFAVMGLLPYIASDFSVSKAEAGGTVAAYSYGVCIGVLYLMLSYRLNLKTSALILIAVHLVSSLATALSGSFELLYAARLPAGLPHGCYIGPGAVIAAKLAGSSGKGASAVAILLAGQTLSNVVGVPLGTFLAHHFSWRLIFWIFSAWAVFTAVCVMLWLPDPGKSDSANFKDQFAFLKKRAPYVIAAAMFFGDAGIFGMYSYVSPILTDFMSFPLAYVPTVLVAAGMGMTVANIIAGKISDLFTPSRVACFLLFSSVPAMMLCYYCRDNLYIALPCLVYSISMIFGLSTPLQVSILRTAQGGALLAVALGQISFNFGISFGAFAGGIPLDAGLSAGYCLLIASAFALFAAVMMLIYIITDEQKFDRSMQRRKELKAEQGK